MWRSDLVREVSGIYLEEAPFEPRSKQRKSLTGSHRILSEEGCHVKGSVAEGNVPGGGTEGQLGGKGIRLSQPPWRRTEEQQMFSSIQMCSTGALGQGRVPFRRCHLLQETVSNPPV